jgi:hypothetical protein
METQQDLFAIRWVKKLFWLDANVGNVASEVPCPECGEPWSGHWRSCKEKKSGSYIYCSAELADVQQFLR